MKENEELVGNIVVGVEDWQVVRHVDEYLDPFKRYRLLMSHYFINTTVYILIDNLCIRCTFSQFRLLSWDGYCACKAKGGASRSTRDERHSAYHHKLFIISNCKRTKDQ